MQLYHDFYCTGYPLANNQMSDATTHYLNTLMEANSGSGYYEGGWEMSGVDCRNINTYKFGSVDNNRKDVTAQVRRDGLQLSAKMKDVLIPNGSKVALVNKVSVHFPKEMRKISPGFYLASSNVLFSRIKQRKEQVTRFYLNLSPEGAIIFMYHATAPC